ncbi:MAG: zinc dependent phospholipase C family protein [Saprospiraceae bacterium]|nr:zinc dependent phospholipase C family protein [Saprospiraceae bacterium]
MKPRLTILLLALSIISTSFFSKEKRETVVSTIHNTPPTWGFFSHKLINRLAVFTLPEEMLPLFKPNIDYISEQAVAPDKRRFIVANEGFRHYINFDRWTFLPQDKLEAQILHTDIFLIGERGDTILLFDFASIRRLKRDYYLKAKTIKKLFGRDSIIVADSTMRRFFINNTSRIQPDEDFPISIDSIIHLFKKERLILRGSFRSAFAKDKLTPSGILPFHLVSVQRQLTAAFIAKDKNRVLKLAAEIGHYIADAHVPLHTVSNYDGQQTNQSGIHAFWESRLPELFAKNQYDFFVGQAEYFDNPKKYYWNIIMESNKLVARTLKIEKEVAATFRDDNKYCPETVNRTVLKKPCFDFAQAYHEKLDGMIEERMQGAILSIGSTWLTAWTDAGKPNLENFNLTDTPLSIKIDTTETAGDTLLKNGGKMIGRHEAY